MKGRIFFPALMFSYFSAGAILFPYFPIYLCRLFEPWNVGILMAIIPVSMMFLQSIWGKMADKWGIQPILALALSLSMLSACGLLFATSFADFFIVLAVYSVFMVPILSLIDALVLSVNSSAYGRIRLWGSVGYGITVFLGGVFKTHILGFWSFLIHIFLLLFTLILVVWNPCGKSSERAKKAENSSQVRSSIFKKEYIVILAASFLVGMSNKATDTFFPVELDYLKASDFVMGIAWLVKMIPEVILFYLLDKASQKIHPQKLLFIGIIIYALRMGIIRCFPVLTVWVMSQVVASMALCFWYYGTVTAINGMLEDNQKSMGYSVFWAVTYGFGEMTGSLSSGYIVSKFGILNLFGIVTVAYFLSSLILCLGRKEKREIPAGA